jgi:hypothetical protein
MTRREEVGWRVASGAAVAAAIVGAVAVVLAGG